MVIDIDDTKLNTWFERDRAHVALVDKDTEQVTYVEWWDEDVASMAESGYLVMGKGEAALKKSVYLYAEEHGLLPHRKQYRVYQRVISSRRYLVEAATVEQAKEIVEAGSETEDNDYDELECFVSSVRDEQTGEETEFKEERDFAEIARDVVSGDVGGLALPKLLQALAEECLKEAAKLSATKIRGGGQMIKTRNLLMKAKAILLA